MLDFLIMNISMNKTYVAWFFFLTLIRNKFFLSIFIYLSFYPFKG